MGSNNFLLEAVLRAASLRDARTDSSSDAEDNVYTTVHSPITSPPTQSRASSPAPSPNTHSSRNQSRVGLRAKREAALKAKMSSKDPLRRFPADVSVRIFTIIGLGADGCGGQHDGLTFSAVKDLLNCGLVCQKWRISPIINYVWYKLCQQHSYSESIENEFGPLTWTRKDSKTDWSKKYKILNEVKPNPISTVIESNQPREETLSKSESNQKLWREQEGAGEGGENLAMDKNQARAFYKELGGRKLKMKNHRGGSDRTGWDEREYFE